MGDDPRVEPLAKRMFCTQYPGAMFKWDELSEPIKDEYRRLARLALSLIDARVKVAREALMRAQRYIPNAFEYGRIEQAIYDLDALARELEPEPKEPTLVEAVEAMFNDKSCKSEACLMVRRDLIETVAAALARAKGGQS